MADRKISDLTALTAPASGDYLPIVDISEASAANKNKRITIEELLRGAPNGTAAAPGFAFESDGGNGMYLAGTDTVGLATNGVERARIDSSGRLLVGTSSARTNWFNLTVTGPLIQAESSSNQMGLSSTYTANNSSGPIIALGKTRGSAYEVVSSGDAIGLIAFQGSDGTKLVEAARIQAEVDGTPGANDMPGRLVFSTTADGASSPTERMRIRENGNLLINTTTEGAGIGFNTKLAIEGTDVAVFKNSAGVSANLIYAWNAATSGNNAFFGFGTENTYTARGSINYNRSGGVVAYNTTSDYRAKTLIGEIENPGETIDALKVYRGVMNGATVERPMLVAHEAQEVAPYCVTGEKDAVDENGNPIYQQMDHQVLIPLLIAEIQSLRQRVAALESA